MSFKALLEVARSDVEQDLNSFPVKGESSVGRSPAKLFRMRP
jgi:hypothetical protein